MQHEARRKFCLRAARQKDGSVRQRIIDEALAGVRCGVFAGATGVTGASLPRSLDARCCQ